MEDPISFGREGREIDFKTIYGLYALEVQAQHDLVCSCACRVLGVVFILILFNFKCEEVFHDERWIKKDEN